MNYISYSLWGDDPVYTRGAIENAKQIPEIYPEWKMVVYYGSDVPSDTIEELNSSQCLCLEADESYYGMFWRFFAVDLASSEHVIFRDCDSRLSFREKFAVDEWIASGKSAHSVRDHPLHRIPHSCSSPSFLGGMWGIKSGTYPLVDKIKKSQWSKEFSYGADQGFLQEVYGFFSERNDITIHNEFESGNKIAYPREDYRFIGERMTIDNNPTCEDWTMIRDYMP